MAKTIQQWFDAYGESHQHPTNTLIHWICVPTIYFCVVGLLYAIPLPDMKPFLGTGSLALLALALVAIFYLRLSLTIAIGMIAFSALCLYLARWIDLHAARPLWQVCLALFVLAWIGQFYGHKVEGKKPSFLHDIQFLMIGPAWLMGKLYRRLGIGY